MANPAPKTRFIRLLWPPVIAVAVLAIMLASQGLQYFAAYAGGGFARPLPRPGQGGVPMTGLSQACPTQPFKVVTFNVMLGSDLLDALFHRLPWLHSGHYPPWSARSPEIRERIASYQPDLIGLQEVVTDADIHQITDSRQYSLVTYHLGRMQYGDAALLFRTARFELLDSGQLWLGPQPELPMVFGYKPWAMIRYSNWAVLREKASGFIFLFVNSHVDNARLNKENSATLFRDQIATLAKHVPMIVTGDFNTTAATERYRRFIGADETPPLLKNAYSLLRTNSGEVKGNPLHRIDHILVGGPCEVEADQWLIDSRPLHNGQRMSDHDLIYAQLRFLPTVNESPGP